MEKNPLCIQTQILPDIKKKVLFKGSILAFLGIFELFYIGNFFSIDFLQKWGFVSFFSGVFLIYIGLAPYRKICHKELFSDTLMLFTDRLCFLKGQKITKTIALDQIMQMEYISTFFRYGIKVRLKNNQRSIFFPYFKKETFDLVQTTLQNIMHS